MFFLAKGNFLSPRLRSLPGLSERPTRISDRKRRCPPAKPVSPSQRALMKYTYKSGLWHMNHHKRWVQTDMDPWPPDMDG